MYSPLLSSLGRPFCIDISLLEHILGQYATYYDENPIPIL